MRHCLSYLPGFPCASSPFHLVRRSGLLLLLLASSLSLLAEYKVVMRSGKVYVCQERFETSHDGLIRFQVVNGPELSVPRETIDWYETYVTNDEPVPEGVRPLVVEGEAEEGPPDLRDALAGDDPGAFLEALKATIGLAMLIGLGVFGFLLQSFCLWFSFRMVGEYVEYLRCLIWLFLGIGVTLGLGLIQMIGVVGILPLIATVGSGKLAIALAVLFYALSVYVYFWAMDLYFDCGILKGIAVSFISGLITSLFMSVVIATILAVVSAT